MTDIEQVAEQIAREAHAGQTRRDGSPYIEHPRRVAQLVRVCGVAKWSSEWLVAAAWLHDVVEDTAWTCDDVRARLLDKVRLPDNVDRRQISIDTVCELVDLVTHRQGETYDQYIYRVASHGLAVAVKAADIVDNLSDDPTDSQRAKYCAAIVQLWGA